MVSQPRHAAILETSLECLIAKAKDASQYAYCPYSKLSVGAALLTDNGEIFAACNVENASYGLTVCAERNTVFQMVANAQRKIVALATYTPMANLAPPCGACRQVINEFGPKARIVSVCDGPEKIDTTLDKLLPAAFGPEDLK